MRDLARGLGFLVIAAVPTLALFVPPVVLDHAGHETAAGIWIGVPIVVMLLLCAYTIGRERRP